MDSNYTEERGQSMKVIIIIRTRKVGLVYLIIN